MLLLEPTLRSPKRIHMDPGGFYIKKRSTRHFDLKLWGRLPRRWIGSLCAGLRQTGISIISGRAKKVQGSWEAEFRFIANGGATDVARINYLSLAMDNLDGSRATDIILDDFLLYADLAKHSGALFLEVAGRGQLGFLGAVIDRCAFYALFPEAVLISTVDGRARDRFWIKGLGGHAPSNHAIHLLSPESAVHIS